MLKVCESLSFIRSSCRPMWFGVRKIGSDRVDGDKKKERERDPCAHTENVLNHGRLLLELEGSMQSKRQKDTQTVGQTDKQRKSNTETHWNFLRLRCESSDFLLRSSIS